MTPKKTPIAAPTEKDHRWVTLKRWIDQQITDLKNPRMSDIILAGRQLGLSAKETRQLVQKNIPAYRQTTSKIFESRKKSRMYNTRVLGIYQADLGFFEKNAPELTRIGKKQVTGALVMRDILSKYVLATSLGPGRKSAESIKKAFETLFAKHDKTRDYPVRAILFDGEPGVNSIIVKAMFAQRKPPVSLHIYRHSSTKAQLAEGLIASLRAAFQRVAIHDPNAKKWHQIIEKIAESMNEKPLIINNRKMRFSPNDITQKTLGKFLKELESLAPAYEYSHFSLDPAMFTYKFKIGDYVALKMKAVSTDVMEKRSANAVDAEEWKILDYAAYYSSKLEIVLCYIIEAILYDVGTQKVATEDQLVQIVPTLEK